MRGIATLTHTNVYANRAGSVSSLFFTFLELSSSAPLERYVFSWLAGWRGTLHLGLEHDINVHLHLGNADQCQGVR